MNSSYKKKKPVKRVPGSFTGSEKVAKNRLVTVWTSPCSIALTLEYVISYKIKQNFKLGLFYYDTWEDGGFWKLSYMKESYAFIRDACTN